MIKNHCDLGCRWVTVCAVRAQNPNFRAFWLKSGQNCRFLQNLQKRPDPRFTPGLVVIWAEKIKNEFFIFSAQITTNPGVNRGPGRFLQNSVILLILQNWSFSWAGTLFWSGSEFCPGPGQNSVPDQILVGVFLVFGQKGSGAKNDPKKDHFFFWDLAVNFWSRRPGPSLVWTRPGSFLSTFGLNLAKCSGTLFLEGNRLKWLKNNT